MDAAGPDRRITRAAAAAASAGAAAAATAKKSTTGRKTTTPAAAEVAKAPGRPKKAPKSAIAAASKAPATAAAASSPEDAGPKKRKVRSYELKNELENELEIDDEDEVVNQPAKKRGRPTKADAPGASKRKANAKSNKSASMAKAEASAEAQEAKAATRTTNDRARTSARSTTTAAAAPKPTKATTAKSAATQATTSSAAKAKTAPTTTNSQRGRPSKATANGATPSVLKPHAQKTIARARRPRKATAANVAALADAIAAKEAEEKPAHGDAAAAGTSTNTYATKPTPGLKSAVSRPEDRVDGALKKTVTFREAEKENIAPAAVEPSASGMRAKPVRKPAATSTRATRASARAAAKEATQKKPLSPKKDVQNRSLSRDAGSDDELATHEKTPLRPLMKSPVKPPASARNIELPREEKEKDESSPKHVESSLTSTLASPARRPPSSPFKDAMKSPAKRAEGVATLLFAPANIEVQGAQTPAKSSMLRSPAKRPQMPLPAFEQPSQGLTGPRSPSKVSSLLSTPAKRPASAIKLPGPSVPLVENDQEELPGPSTPLVERNQEELPGPSTPLVESDQEEVAVADQELSVTEKPANDVDVVEQDAPAEVEEPIKAELLQAQFFAEVEYALARHEYLAKFGNPDFDSEESDSEDSDSEDEVSEDEHDEDVHNEDEVQLPSPSEAQLEFPGRLSAILPRHADPALKNIVLPTAEATMQPSASAPNESEEVEMSDSDAASGHHDAQSAASGLKEDLEEATNEEATIQTDPVSVFEAQAEQVRTAVVEDELVETGEEHVPQDESANELIVPTTPQKQSAASSLEADDKESASDSEDELALSEAVPRDVQPATQTMPSPEAISSLLGPAPRLTERMIQTARRAVEAASWRNRYHPYRNPPMRYGLSPRKKSQDPRAEETTLESAAPVTSQSKPVQLATTEPEASDSQELHSTNIQADGVQVVSSELSATKSTEIVSENIETGDAQLESSEPRVTETKEAGTEEEAKPAPRRPKRVYSEMTEIERLVHELVYNEVIRPETNAPEVTEATKSTEAETQAETQVAAQTTTIAAGKTRAARVLATIEEEGEESSILDAKDMPAVQMPAVQDQESQLDNATKMQELMKEKRETAALMASIIGADIEFKFRKAGAQEFALWPHARQATPPGGNRQTLFRSLRPEVLSGTESASGSKIGNASATTAVDPALLRAAGFSPITPKRKLASTDFEFVNTGKKPATKFANGSPLLRKAKRHCPSSVAKSAPRRPAKEQTKEKEQKPEQKQEPAPPSTPEHWDPMDIDSSPPANRKTPILTPESRPTLNPNLLEGACIFVDVRTGDGSDAGRAFIELLNQMGAKCLKNWHVDPTKQQTVPTHVVFKDGNPQTLEKANKSNGRVKVVQCGWVLDCEKENKWLDETDYRVDTSLIPRGGRGPRKSMEPTPLANVNGVLVTPTRGTSSGSREPQTVPNNHMSRRDSSLWVRSPSEHDDEEDAPGERDFMDADALLTPVPKTPAPETVAQFAMNVSPATPTTGSIDLGSPSKKEALMKTCPPKPVGNRLFAQGSARNAAGEYKDERVEAARRRTLLYRPKHSSPLKKQWKATD